MRSSTYKQKQQTYKSFSAGVFLIFAQILMRLMLRCMKDSDGVEWHMRTARPVLTLQVAGGQEANDNVQADSNTLPPPTPSHKDRQEVHRYGAVARFPELIIQTLYVSFSRLYRLNGPFLCLMMKSGSE